MVEAEGVGCKVASITAGGFGGNVEHRHCQNKGQGALSRTWMATVTVLREQSERWNGISSPVPFG